MKNIKKLIIFIMCIGVLSGCSNISPEEDFNIKRLKEDLNVMVKESTKEYFNLDIDLNDFKISLGEKIDNNQFEKLKTIETVNNIYFTGLYKEKPKDVISFVLVYDSKNEKILEFGVQTVDDEEVVYAKLGEK